MWLLLAVPLFFSPKAPPEPVALFSDGDFATNESECRKWAATWNADLEMIKRRHYVTFECRQVAS